ncbi:MAG: PaaI family thioesterase [Desulfotignum sp.]|nr:PaaI family thioesterase [Desulfotignum sp.]MCF8126300.1 PaaI family thioesterase [Desulfotignum sp.]
MKSPDPKYVETLKKMVKESPYPAHMRMTLEEIEMDRCEILIRLSECHLQPFGIVHGGVVATIIDTATFWAAFLRLPEDYGLVNIDLKLNYLLPVVEGSLVAKGFCIRPGRSVSYAEAKVFNGQGKLVAHGTSGLMALPGKGIDLGIPKFS